MAKLNQLLDETTLINFKLFFKLVGRYRAHLVIALLFFILFFSYFYFRQSVIYSVTIPLKSADKPSVGIEAPSFMAMPGSTRESVSVNELSAMLDSFTFLKSFSEAMLKDPLFDTYDFGNHKTGNLQGKEIRRMCRNEETCMVERLAGSLEGLFIIEKGLTENRFFLTINSKDKKSIKKITEILIQTIDLHRIGVRKYLVSKEMDNVAKLLEESRAIMKEVDGFTALEEQEKLQHSINDLKDRTRLLQTAISTETSNASLLEAQMAENKKATKSNIVKGTEKYEQAVKAMKKLVEVRQNIVTISGIPEEHRTSSDNIILTELHKEEAMLLKKVPREGDVRSMESVEAFKEKQFDKASNIAFDHIVSKNRLAKLQSDYEKLKTELSELLQKKMANENKVNALKSDLEFYKSLEAKHMSLKLHNATMTTDLIFEDFSRETKEFRSSSYLKMIIFSFVLTLFFYMGSLIVRYALDDRIYGEEELLNHFNHLDFIGEVPAFK